MTHHVHTLQTSTLLTADRLCLIANECVGEPKYILPVKNKCRAGSQTLSVYFHPIQLLEYQIWVEG